MSSQLRQKPKPDRLQHSQTHKTLNSDPWLHRPFSGAQKGGKMGRQSACVCSRSRVRSHGGSPTTMYEG